MSFVLDQPLLYCDILGDGRHAEVVGRILMRLAEDGRCEEASSFLSPANPDPAALAKTAG
jgi:hypothetical protein